jgi:dihydropteroate synthase
MLIGGRLFDFSKKTYVMGILNVTPDSFSDGGLHLDPERALDRALQMELEGADLIDIGAESTRPGSDPVAEDEEWRRLEPVLKKMISRLSVPVSLDTYKPLIAQRGIDLGVALINDINALQSLGMTEVVAKAQVPCILMHKKGEPKTMQGAVHYDDVVREVIHFLRERIETVCAAGVVRDQILVDPGIGFGKRFEDNLTLLKNLPTLRRLECPLVIGASRKSFLKALVGDESNNLLAGNLAVVACSWREKVGLVRVHDVKETVTVLKSLPVLSS